MAMQSLFARAVGANLPTAIPTTLERIDQFAIGKVLTYKKKPRKLLPWRRRELSFTGRSVTELLAEGQLQELKFATSSDFLFDAGKGTDKIYVEVSSRILYCERYGRTHMYVCITYTASLTVTHG